MCCPPVGQTPGKTNHLFYTKGALEKKSQLWPLGEGQGQVGPQENTLGLGEVRGQGQGELRLGLILGCGPWSAEEEHRVF